MAIALHSTTTQKKNRNVLTRHLYQVRCLVALKGLNNDYGRNKGIGDMKDTKTFIDYLVDQREWYISQIELCRQALDTLDHYSLDYKSYKWQLCEYEARLDCINDLLGAVKPKD